MAFINFQPQSAAAAVGNAFQLKQMEDARNQNRRNLMYQGIKDAGSALASVINYQKRKAAIQYLGDDKLAEMKRELAALKTELETVDNQLRTIKAEDIGSLDINQDLAKESETDVNAWNAANGGRMTETPVNTPYGTQDASMMKVGTKALGGF